MRAIFISYRRDDTEGHARTLFQDLVKAFGADAVFMDVAGIKPGIDFRKIIDANTASCCVLLAIIGKQWAGAVDDAGARRLDDPMDFVRLETASALKRDIPVIPVLVHGARMPRAEQLPDDLKELVFRNNVELTHARWDSDVQLLIQALRPLFDAANAAEAQAAQALAPPPLPGPSPGPPHAAPPATPPTPSPTPVPTPPPKPGVAWLAGLALAVAAVGGGGYEAFKAWQRADQEQVLKAEAARQAEAARVALEAAQAAQAEKAAQLRRDEAAEAANAAEQARKVKEEARAAEQARKAADARAADEAAKARDAKAADAARTAAAQRAAEEARAADEAQQARLAEDARRAREAAAADQARKEREAAAGAAAQARKERDAAAAQAIAQAAADAQRRAREAHAAGICITGYVWRGAVPADRVCVAPQVRTDTGAENALANARREPGGGPYGPDTCRQGYVWREAFAGDRVCVPPASRSRAAADNANAAARIVP